MRDLKISEGEIHNQFAVFMKEKREAMGYSLTEFSIFFYGKDTNRHYLWCIEKGKKHVNLKTMQFLLNKLNCKLYIEEL